MLSQNLERKVWTNALHRLDIKVFFNWKFLKIMKSIKFLISSKSVHIGRRSNNLARKRFLLLKWLKRFGRTTNMMLLLNQLVSIGMRCLNYGQMLNSFIFTEMLKAGQGLSSKSETYEYEHLKIKYLTLMKLNFKGILQYFIWHSKRYPAGTLRID